MSKLELASIVTSIAELRALLGYLLANRIDSALPGNVCGKVREHEMEADLRVAGNKG